MSELNELYIEKLLRLIKNGIVTVDDIKNEDYKIEVQNRVQNRLMAQ